MVAPSSFLARHTINSVQILINIALCVLSVELTGDGQSPPSPPEAMLYLVLIVYSTAINSVNIVYPISPQILIFRTKHRLPSTRDWG